MFSDLTRINSDYALVPDYIYIGPLSKNYCLLLSKCLCPSKIYMLLFQPEGWGNIDEDFGALLDYLQKAP